MAADPSTGPPIGVPVIMIPEIRDYQRINAELIRMLDEGHARVRLAGAEGQRLLVAGLKGNWQATVEIEGRAGLELACGLDAPGLTVIVHGSALDGAGSGFRAGRLVVKGSVGVAVGYAQRGGGIVVHGEAGARAGLNQMGGVLALLGAVGAMPGERQRGGRLHARRGHAGCHERLGASGGQFHWLDEGPVTDEDLEAILTGPTTGEAPPPSKP